VHFAEGGRTMLATAAGNLRVAIWARTTGTTALRAPGKVAPAFAAKGDGPCHGNLADEAPDGVEEIDQFPEPGAAGEAGRELRQGNPAFY